MVTKVKKWKRNCSNPECEKEITYTRKFDRDTAETQNINCRSCTKKGKNNPMYEKFGENNPNFGSKRSEKIKKNMSKNHADFSGKNNPMFGKRGVSWNKGKINVYSAESLLKMRLSALKRIEKLNGQISPNYNPVACGIINDYNKKHGFNFRHAENGGEVCIDGYWPDGVDGKRKTIIEIDEKHHFNGDGTLKEKDSRRQEYLEGLGYKFIRIKI